MRTPAAEWPVSSLVSVPLLLGGLVWTTYNLRGSDFFDGLLRLLRMLVIVLVPPDLLLRVNGEPFLILIINSSPLLLTLIRTHGATPTFWKFIWAYGMQSILMRYFPCLGKPEAL